MGAVIRPESGLLADPLAAAATALVPVPDAVVDQLAPIAPSVSPPAPAAEPFPAQARSDTHLLELWLFGKAVHTARYYRRVAGSFLHMLGAAGLHGATLGDLQAWTTALSGADGSRHVALAAVKSLLTFGNRIGYLPVNVGAAIKLPPVRDALAERILPREAVYRLIDREPDPRNRALLKLLYVAGLRVSEACALRWRDLAERDTGRGQVTVFGKGGKTRRVLLPAAVWREIVALRGEGAGDETPVFRPKRAALPLDDRQARRLVEAAAQRAGLPRSSPHWLRHAHASHVLEHGGASVALVRDSLGHASVATTSRYLHAHPENSSALHLGY
jgi:site-specific recombinase XerD